METIKPKTIGVDVCKATLDAALLFTDESFAEAQFSNDAKGIKQLLAWANKHHAQRCPLCVEATGNLELDLCIAGYEAEHPIKIATPVAVANFRKTLGLRNKTDGVDARLIAQFIAAIPRGNDWKKPSKAALALRDALKVHRQLTQAHTALSNCVNTVRDAAQKRTMAATLKHLEKQRDKTSASMTSIIAQDKRLTQLHQLLCSIPGIGAQTAAILCAVLDNNTFENPRQLAAYIGLTPRRQQSGNREGRSYITKQGNAHLRTALFMAALSARVHNPLIRAFADQLSRRRPDLSKKQIIVACAHKLARIVFGVVTYQRPFDPNYIREAVA